MKTPETLSPLNFLEPFHKIQLWVKKQVSLDLRHKRVLDQP